MPKLDSLLKSYFGDKTIFADVFNYLIYDGEQVIKPESLRTLSPETVVLQHDEDGKVAPYRRVRDLLKAATIMTDGRVAYAALGLENQTYVDNAMPARTLDYNATYYMLQVEEIIATHNANHDRPQSRDEFLSGFRREDRLIPTVTATLFFSPESWTGAKTLYEMFDPLDLRLARLIPNHSANIIVPAELTSEDFKKMTPGLRLVLESVKYCKDKNLLREIVHSDHAFTSLSRRAAELLYELLKIRLPIPNNEETVDMCKAIDDIRAEGFEEGIEQGIGQGIEQGVKQERVKTIQLLSGLVSDGFLPLEEAAKRLGVTVAEFQSMTL